MTLIKKARTLGMTFVFDAGNGRKITLHDPVSTLGRYNAERSRGIVHTPKWQSAMAELQRQFDEGELR